MIAIAKKVCCTQSLLLHDDSYKTLVAHIFIWV